MAFLTQDLSAIETVESARSWFLGGEVPVRERLVNVAPARVPFLLKNATGCKAGDKCLFPHYNVD